jgi:hypothetical protein
MKYTFTLIFTNDRLGWLSNRHKFNRHWVDSVSFDEIQFFYNNSKWLTNSFFVLGFMVMSGYEISSDVYAWIIVFIFPVNSALNPVLYTWSLSKSKSNRVSYFKCVSFLVKYKVLPHTLDKNYKYQSIQSLCTFLLIQKHSRREMRYIHMLVS